MAVIITDVFTGRKFVLYFVGGLCPYTVEDIRRILSAITNASVEVIKDGTTVNETSRFSTASSDDSSWTVS